MSAVKQIQCPACGANSTFKQLDGSYRCNYCQSNFELKDSQKKPQPQKTNITFNSTDLKPVKRGCGISVLAGLIAVIGAGIAFFMTIKESSTIAGGLDSIFSEWQKPSLNIYQSFVGSKGPVIWEISSQTRNKLDSAKYSIEIIDPQTNSVLTEKPVFETMTWTESFGFNKKLSSQFFQMGDIAYNCSEENGLTGYDIYSFDIVVDEESLGKKHSELHSGISKAELMGYKNAFHFTTNKGKEFVYYPETDMLRTKHKDDNSYKSDVVTDTKIYLSDKQQLYLIGRKRDNTRDELNVSEHIITQYEKRKNHGYDINSLQKISEREFFKAQPLLRINDAMVLIYVDDLSKKAKVHLECVNQEGKSVWINSDEVLQELKNNNSDRLSFEYRHNDEFLTISLWGAKRKTHCFNLKTGKLVWSYSTEK